ncbi:MAG: phosphodiester glycosidase family protein [Armatimonadetes bacterium]|nr:phosphodiester glycosidase family protein [Armatimonadota bacterium]
MSEPKVEGAPCRVIEVNLDSSEVRVGVVVSYGFPDADQSFGEMVKISGATYAIDGAYFDKTTKHPIGDIVVDGKLLHKGLMGTALMIDPHNNVDIRRVERHRTQDWSDYETVLACGPALVLDGKIDVNFKEEGFRDPHVTGATQRMAVGYTQDKRLLMVHIRKAVTFAQEASIMNNLGCYEAMNLDGGASLAMFGKGKTHQEPGRKLTNLLAVWVR